MVAIRDDPGSLWRSLTNRVSGLLADSPAEVAIAEGAIMAGFVDASRNANSFQQAMQLALGSLTRALHAESAQLLARETGGPYLCVAATPGTENMCSVPADRSAHRAA